MIDAEVKSLDYADPLPVSADAPAAVAMTLSIGERGSEASDNFQVLACTPGWVAREVEKSGGLWPRGMLIVPRIEPDYVRAAVQALAGQFRGSADWAQFSERLNRYLRWEYEDYNDHQGEPRLPKA